MGHGDGSPASEAIPFARLHSPALLASPMDLEPPTSFLAVDPNVTPSVSLEGKPQAQPAAKHLGRNAKLRTELGGLVQHGKQAWRPHDGIVRDPQLASLAASGIMRFRTKNTSWSSLGIEIPRTRKIGHRFFPLLALIASHGHCGAGRCGRTLEKPGVVCEVLALRRDGPHESGETVGSIPFEGNMRTIMATAKNDRDRPRCSFRSSPLQSRSARGRPS